MSRKTKRIGIFLSLILLGVVLGYLFIVPALLNSDYVKRKVVEIVKSSMGAEVSFKTFEVDVKSGRLSLTEVEFIQDKPESTFKADVKSATMEAKLKPLLWKKVYIKKLELESPEISLVRRGGSTEDESKRAEDKKFKPSGKFAVDEIIIKDGKFDYVSDGADGEHVEAGFGGLDYRAVNITTKTLARLVSSSLVEVSNVRVIQKSLKTDMVLSTDKLTIENDPKKSRTDLYKVDTIEIYKPQIRYVVQREAEKPAASTKDRILNLINETLSEPEVEKEQEAERVDQFLYSVSDLKIDGGQLEYVAKREGAPPFEAELTNLEYHGHDLAYESFSNLVIGADIDADIDMGGVSKLHKKAGEDSSEFYLTGVNFGYIDRYFSQSDALVIESGNMDISYNFDERYRGFYDVQLSDFRLVNNPEAKSQEFMFIPVSKITDFVNSREERLDLRFELDSKFKVSDDLEDIVTKVWEGMWRAILKYITVEGIDVAVEKLPLNEKAEKVKGIIEKTIKEHKE